MKFHINPERGPMKCSATKRPCKYSGDEHFDSRESAQGSFEASLRENFGEISGISKKRSIDFSKSKVVDANGQLIPVYHGSAIEFDEFSAEFTGSGNDSYGSGFYFNTDKDTAAAYGGYMKKVKLNITNPIKVDGNESMSLNEISIPLKAVKQILKSVPNIYNQPNDEDMNPLGDYSPKFWEKEHHSKAELDQMIDGMAREYFSDASFIEVEHLFEGGETDKFRRALSETMGWDGVEVRFPREKISHWIAWFPEQIELDNS